MYEKLLPDMSVLDEIVPFPHLNAHFRLVIDGLGSTSFSQCTGLGGEIGVEEYAEGGENRFTHRFPSRVGFGNLVLKQGAGPSLELWRWWEEYLASGTVTPRDGQVHLLSWVGDSLQPVRTWTFARGWPVKMSGSDFDAQTAAPAVETMEIAHRGLRVLDVGI